jgi:hypothetical protein
MRGMTELMKRAYRYRFYPTETQAQELARTSGCVRDNQTAVIEDLRVGNLVRGVDAAKNILAAGPADSNACGVGVRPQGVLPGGRSVVKQELPRVTVGIPAH